MTRTRRTTTQGPTKQNHPADQGWCAEAVREDFIHYFRERKHQFVRSAPVVPQGDPTLLFTNAGMNQFKDVFLGVGQRPYRRAVNAQKCIRASGKHNDLEDVGRDNYHHTFFEMLGNWSFGDYFKREAIEFAWALFVDRWGLDAERLYATVFGGDEKQGLEADTDAERLWHELTPLPAARILRGDRVDNFWEMGPTGPCGPCSEVHYDLGPQAPRCEACRNDPQRHCGVTVPGCWRYVELWNLVFIQFNRRDAHHLEPLAASHVDTGMGLERIVRVLQKRDSNYDTDLFSPLLAEVRERTQQEATEGEALVAVRVLADHVRSLAFAIADGAMPSNEGRGYVLRRMLRRAARFAHVLGMRKPFVHTLIPTLCRMMGSAYPELPQRQAHVKAVICAEEEGFLNTLHRGVERFEQLAQARKPGDVLPGAEAFRLYDTYGFPLDLTALMASERGLRVDEEGFAAHMADQRQQSRSAIPRAQAAEAWVELAQGPHSRFVGYDTLERETRVLRYQRAAKGRLALILEDTPFYAEGGGQVADQGFLRTADCAWEVLDVQREGEAWVHFCSGPIPLPQGLLHAAVNAQRRERSALHHTATHLLHAALREELGEHAHQAGSVVQPESLRFDYTHFERPTEEALERIETRVNTVIRENKPLRTHETSYHEALEEGAMALFGEKYGDLVRVVRVGDFSVELCGGCHVRATGELGLLAILSESGIASGVRRIVAVAGAAAEERARSDRRLVERMRRRLQSTEGELDNRIDALLDRQRTLERELREVRVTQVRDQARSLLARAKQVGAQQLLVERVSVREAADLRNLGDLLRRGLPRGITLLAAEHEGRALFVCAVSPVLVDQEVHAGRVVSQAAAQAGGRGGGPPHLASGGARDGRGIDSALRQAAEEIATQLANLK